MSGAGGDIAKDRADWLLDAVACATQDRRFLRGDPKYDAVLGDAILLNAEKAINTAIGVSLARVSKAMNTAISASKALRE